ncbi:MULTISPECIES: transglycosylase SLT domain-containing protein [Pseudomonas]|uniref:Transglycosylase SLT domain-containing protein n=1 Tax=Pseudomonas nitroreducens TaxID=46680 RepID=A0A6G6J0G3_PSENT|nr:MULTISPECIES: transglycosylase SLT domain-containing protein [Pseudomonas]MBG6285885.1 transglycosylase SLT domain-containing protein [Pseudomonas nitroreducens]MCJ1881345.1 transglycosylase SLT domain-containing protein [Pseudomonas nitroreducens]MCJ1893520.1 transglycosylase SLT domain-containing protein [Pseudomonas nitroreducens]MDG9857259.1 transglycosylase SLT domain-containing protein [Pseudomonas nitroreducens]MDH1075103.1 transglycosylase SLT domain-containing protein [Pseudomonas 
MRGRLFSLFSCLILSLSASTANAASLPQQRQMYDEAQKALARNDSGPYFRYQSALADYPLQPYLAYDELTNRLKSASNAEIERFIEQHGDLPQINWLKLRWMRQLADQGDWNTFVRYYDPKMNFTELDCLYGQYQLGHGNKAEGYATAEKLWLVGKPQPDACDTTFAMWQADGQLTEEKVWKRLKLAAEKGNYSLATVLSKRLPTLGSQGALMVNVAQNPAQLSQTTRFGARDHATADVVGLGLRRLAKQDPEKAITLLDYYSSVLPFSSDEKVSIAREIGLSLARRYDPRALPMMVKYDPQLRDDTVTEWRLRLLLRLGRWEEAYELTRALPPSLAETNRWKYWQARSLQLAQPQNKQAVSLYKPVADERDFYGFLAADRINAPYQLNNRPVSPDAGTMQRVRNAPSTRRALEFYARGEIINARREWYHAARHLSHDELLAQAKIAYDMQWYFPAIRAISQAKYWDDLDIRFPMAYRNTLVREARNRGLHSSWVFAITRQESAFMSDARSGVGATGLMQLMPATAKETSRKFGIPLASPQQLIVPDVNIQLGAAYLSQVHGQFNGNRVLATAAYNAGPGRVRQWLKDARHLAFDVWVETIPFDETRSYVQNVLSYAVIYGQKLNAPQPIVDWHERFFDEL